MKKFFQVPIAAVTALLILASLVSVGFSQRADLGWQITVDGAVQNTLRLTIADLIAMPRTYIVAELTCYGEPLENGEWAGVKLGYLLAEANVTDQNMPVTFKASDGYAVKDFPMSEAMREDVILAYELEGKALPETIRLVVPEANGDVWIRQITQITVQASSSSTPSGNPVQPQLPSTPLGSQPLTQPSLQPAPVQTSSPALNVSVPQQPVNQSTVQQPDPLSSPSPVGRQEVAESPTPIDYSYALVAVALGAAGAAAGIIIVKRRKTNQQ